VAIHTQIANILKQNFESNPDSALRNELAPLIISHSSVTGDQSKIEDVLKEQINTAQIENEQIYLQSIHNFLQINQQTEESTQFEVEQSDAIMPQLSTSHINQNFPNIIPLKFEDSDSINLNLEAKIEQISIDKIIDTMLSGGYENAKREINLFVIQDISNELKNQARLCLIKIFIEGKNEDAKVLLETLKNDIKDEEKSNRIILDNLEALYNFQEGRIDKAIEILQNTAKAALTQDNFAKILTLSNISILLNSKDKDLADTYYGTIEGITKSLNFQDFLQDYKKHFN
jgi:vacuolar-type H+-ATPase subunit I/STV1